MSLHRPTILQIIPELDTGGAELSAIEIAGAIVKAGGRALVLSEGGRLAARLAAAGAEFVPFAAASKNPSRILLNARAISRMVEREGVDLVHARSRAPAWSARLAARATGKPFVTTYHGAYRETNALKRAYNRVMAAGDIVIANSQYTSALVQSRYGTPEGQIRVIYRGVDGAEFDPAAIAPSRTEALRRDWGVAAATPVVLNPARLTAWKGQPVLIDAAARLREMGALGDAVIVLAGDEQGRDGYRAQLQQQIAAAGLGDHVKLVGHVADMPAAYATAHLAVVASVEPEAFGRVGAEAQIMGCPIIATAIGAPQETVLAEPRVASDARTGWLVAPADGAAMAQAMAAALQLAAAERAALGARARAHVLQSFSLAVMCRQTLAVYDDLLGTRLAEGFDAAG
jgi:glycosyltransferase involved in cell wall biosynthesis